MNHDPGHPGIAGPTSGNWTPLLPDSIHGPQHARDCAGLLREARLAMLCSRHPESVPGSAARLLAIAMGTIQSPPRDAGPHLLRTHEERFEHLRGLQAQSLAWLLSEIFDADPKLDALSFLATDPSQTGSLHVEISSLRFSARPGTKPPSEREAAPAFSKLLREAIPAGALLTGSGARFARPRDAQPLHQAFAWILLKSGGFPAHAYERWEAALARRRSPAGSP